VLNRIARARPFLSIDKLTIVMPTWTDSSVSVIPRRAVVAPIVGVSKPSHLADAVAALDIELSEDEVAALEAPYTPCYDFQGVSDEAELARISARLGIAPDPS
jgi:hypothetical protein